MSLFEKVATLLPDMNEAGSISYFARVTLNILKKIDPKTGMILIDDLASSLEINTENRAEYALNMEHIPNALLRTQVLKIGRKYFEVVPDSSLFGFCMPNECHLSSFDTLDTLLNFRNLSYKKNRYFRNEPEPTIHNKDDFIKNCPKILSLIRKHLPGAVIAGGSIMSSILCTNEVFLRKDKMIVNDLDIWIIGKEPDEIRKLYANFLIALSEETDETFKIHLTEKVITVDFILYRYNRLPTIQLVFSDYIPHVGALLNTFDLSCAKAALMVDTMDFMCTRDFVYSMITHDVRLEDMPYVTRSLPRIFKYLNRGFSVSVPGNIFPQDTRVTMDVSVLWSLCLLLETNFNGETIPIGLCANKTDGNVKRICVDVINIYNGNINRGRNQLKSTSTKLKNLEKCEFFHQLPLIYPLKHEGKIKLYPLRFKDEKGQKTQRTLFLKNLKAINSIYKEGPSTIYEHYFDVMRLIPKSDTLIFDEENDYENVTPDYTWCVTISDDDVGHFNFNMKGKLYQSEVTFKEYCHKNKECKDVFKDFIQVTVLNKDPIHEELYKVRQKIVILQRSALPDPKGYPFSRPGAELIQGFSAMFADVE
jgi:hypothetical protein